MNIIQTCRKKGLPLVIVHSRQYVATYYVIPNLCTHTLCNQDSILITDCSTALSKDMENLEGVGLYRQTRLEHYDNMEILYGDREYRYLAGNDVEKFVAFYNYLGSCLEHARTVAALEAL